MEFKRAFPYVAELVKEKLFTDCILRDVLEPKKGKRGGVFPAIRNDSIDFYYAGGGLFSFNKSRGFATHHKYALVGKRLKQDGDYITESELETLGLIKDFNEGYERIKENCSHYSGIEAKGVSKLYGKYSCAHRVRSSRIVVLDIEIAFRRDKVELDGSRRMDRIDLLLYDTQDCVLRFFEAKHHSNSEIKANGQPKVVQQVKDYQNQLLNRRDDILKSYKVHVDIINELFTPEEKLPLPKEIDTVPRLLIFGFDTPQKKELNKITVPKLRDYGISVYSVGDTADSKIIESIFTGGKQHW